ncbi:MAG: DUF4281 domain-containing protein [Bdellovibrionales bacterium]|nr:DUF4281 domain-containing protein [Bdellovibrionales bacterium]
MNVSEVFFTAGNALILPCWALLIFFPNSKATRILFERELVIPALVLAVLYGGVAIPGLMSNPSGFAALMKPTLQGVSGLLSSEGGASAGWIHYLCFDLLIGVAVWKTARKEGQRFLWVSPVLGLVLMLGPLGWLVHQSVSGILHVVRK